MSDASALKRLVDLEAIRDLARGYAHAVWQRDAAAAAALFADDGVMDAGGRGAMVGPDAIREAYAEVFATQEFRPMIHNHVVEIDGDTASGTCYLDVRAIVDGVPMIGHGFYRDEYKRVGNGWKFAKRTLELSAYEPAPNNPVD
jgi:ketosteroid isomerase-like protein